MSVPTLVRSTPRIVDLEVHVSAEGPATVVTIRGEVDPASLPVLVDALARVIADSEGGDVVIDLAAADFIDTATLRAVLRARAVLAADGRALTLRSPSMIAGRVLGVFGLAHLVVATPAGGEMTTPR
jgi:anti-anti-sigma factor